MRWAPPRGGERLDGAVLELDPEADFGPYVRVRARALAVRRRRHTGSAARRRRTGAVARRSRLPPERPAGGGNLVNRSSDAVCILLLWTAGFPAAIATPRRATGCCVPATPPTRYACVAGSLRSALSVRSCSVTTGRPCRRRAVVRGRPWPLLLAALTDGSPTRWRCLRLVRARACGRHRSGRPHSSVTVRPIAPRIQRTGRLAARLRGRAQAVRSRPGASPGPGVTAREGDALALLAGVESLQHHCGGTSGGSWGARIFPIWAYRPEVQ